MSLHNPTGLAVTVAVTIGLTTSVFGIAQRTARSTGALDSTGLVVTIGGLKWNGELDDGLPGFERLAHLAYGRVRYRMDDAVGQALAIESTSGLFDVLGITPLAGRTFTRDDAISSEGVAIIGERLWRSRLHSSWQVLGTVFWVNGILHRIVGVVPSSVDPLGGADLFLVKRKSVPARLVDASESDSLHIESVIGRMRPGVSVVAARSSVLSYLGGQVVLDSGGDTGELQVVALRDVLSTQTAELVYGTMFAGAFLLLLGCTNVGFMWLGSLEARRYELATRLALGARGKALALSSILGGATVLGIGMALGTLIAIWISHLAVTAMPAFKYLIGGDSAAGAALALSLLVTALLLILMLLLTVTTVHRLESTDLAVVLTRSSSGRHSSRPQSTARLLVFLSVVFSVSLAGITGLVAANAVSQVRLELGFQPEGLLTFEVWRPPFPKPVFPGAGPPPSSWRTQMRTELRKRVDVANGAILARLGGIPGVMTVGAGSRLPLSSAGANEQWIDSGDPQRGVTAQVTAVAGSYLEAIGTTWTSNARPGSGDASEATVVLSKGAAERLWPGEVSIDRPIHIARGAARRVVGEILPVRFLGMGASQSAQVYLPNSDDEQGGQALAFVIRSQRQPESLVRDVTSAMRDLDPQIVVFKTLTGQALVSSAYGPVRAQVAIAATVTGFALLFCAIGVFGTTQHWLLARRREISIRLALGARLTDICRLVAGQAASVVVAGMVVGVWLGSLASKVLRTVLLGVEPHLSYLFPGAMIAFLIMVLGVFAAVRRTARGATSSLNQ